MRKENPTDLHKSAQAAKVFERFGIPYVPIPCVSEQHRQALIKLADQSLKTLEKIIQTEEENEK